MASAFDRLSQFPLVLGAGASLVARPDLAFFGDESSQQVNLLIVNAHGVVGAKKAHPWSRVKSPLGGAARVVLINLIGHVHTPDIYHPLRPRLWASG